MQQASPTNKSAELCIPGNTPDLIAEVQRWDVLLMLGQEEQTTVEHQDTFGAAGTAKPQVLRNR